MRRDNKSVQKLGIAGDKIGMVDASNPGRNRPDRQGLADSPPLALGAGPLGRIRRVIADGRYGFACCRKPRPA